MYVSSEVRRREIPETSPDPSLYASAAHGASFMAVLSEVGRPPENSAEVAPVSEADGAEKVSATDTKVPDEAVPDDPAAKKSAADEGAQETPDTDSTPAPENPPSTDIVDQPVPPPPISIPTPVAASASVEAAAPDPAVALVASAVESGSGVTVETLSVASGNAPTAKTDAPLLSAALLAGTAAKGAKTEAATESGTVESAPTTESPVEAGATAFPKTLNAIIAEGVLRQPSGEADETDTPLTEDTKLEAVAEQTAPDVPQELPKSPALPQSAALEAGGVRPQTASALPRLPMANLPGELAQQIHLMQQEGATSMRLRLVPENLGDIQIEIHGSGDRLQVRLVSANPAVRDALESQMGDLKNALQKQGLALDNATVGGEAAGRNASRQPERQASSSPSYRTPSALPDVAGTRTRSAAPLALGSSALNILA